MAVFNAMFPVLPGKEDDARKFAEEAQGSHRDQFGAFQKASGTSRETWTLQQTPARRVHARLVRLQRPGSRVRAHGDGDRRGRRLDARPNQGPLRRRYEPTRRQPAARKSSWSGLPSDWASIAKGANVVEIARHAGQAPPMSLDIYEQGLRTPDSQGSPLADSNRRPPPYHRCTDPGRAGTRGRLRGRKSLQNSIFELLMRSRTYPEMVGKMFPYCSLEQPARKPRSGGRISRIRIVSGAR